MRYVAAVLLVALVGLPALAQKTIVDGNSLDDTCLYKRHQDDGANLSHVEFGKAMFCPGYIRGVLDEIWMEQSISDRKRVKNVGPPKICILDDISNEQAIKVVVKYLQDNPAKLQFPANHLIRLSMEQAFPCKSP